VIYLFLIAAFRLVGRRQLAQLTVIDLVVLIVLGSAVETAMIAGNTSLAAGIISAATLLGVNRLLTRLSLRSKRWRNLVVGGPVLLVDHGHIVEEHVRRAGLTEADVLEAIRERGQDRLDAVKFAVLEAGGSINVVPMDAPTYRGEVRRPREPLEPRTHPQ
jgi:uncharacterized membrane protein YcaP (DUF421 family)